MAKKAAERRVQEIQLLAGILFNMIDDAVDYIELDNWDWLDSLYDGLHRLDLADFEIVPMDPEPDIDY